MQLYQGHVSRMSLTGEVSGDAQGFSTKHIITCLVDGKAVEIAMPSPPAIHPGDEIVVAGPVKRGTLKARAYNNLSNGSNGRWNYGIIVLAMSVGILCMMIGSSAPPLVVLPLALGIWVFVTGPVRTFRAYRKVLWWKTPQADEAPREVEEPKFRIEQEERRLPSPSTAKLAATAPPTTSPETVSVSCPKCGKRLKVSRAQIGKRVKCPRTDCATIIDTKSLRV